ncbi:hypothetical protein FHS16_005414 [Paenibacillus endophyticus]|uniref:HD-GYP domain-containing protein n=1 Tax=Paenibacillus endophyticus TaxID=1294268 RepID=A0A7W5GCW3_9BACL|nr:HD domain-containing phosphohydrolase [Paenibacillus endophyticus]MBB3155306.1 hypothetical protein [Paenibacillus endophyticus]
MKYNKLLSLPIHHMILILIGCMTTMIALLAIVDAAFNRSNMSLAFVMAAMTIAVLAWGMFDYQKNLFGDSKYIKLIVVLFLYLIMLALSLYYPMLFRQIWVIVFFIPVMCSLLTTYREYAYSCIFFFAYFVVYTVAGTTGMGGEADATVLSAFMRILLALGSVLLGGIVVIARHQQAKQLEVRALQQQKQQIIHMLQCFVPVGERKTQTSRKEISEMSLLLKGLWKEYGGTQTKDWEIELLSLLHFVSRVKLPDYMFEKEGKLSEFELEVVQEHCYMAKELCEGIPGFLEVQNVFLYHHEKVDGTGYPYCLKEDQIPLLSQMLGVVEVFLAMTTPRSYRQAMSKREAYEEIRKLAGTSFRADIIQAFGKVIV